MAKAEISDQLEVDAVEPSRVDFDEGTPVLVRALELNVSGTVPPSQRSRAPKA